MSNRILLQSKTQPVAMNNLFDEGIEMLDILKENGRI